MTDGYDHSTWRDGLFCRVENEHFERHRGLTVCPHCDMIFDPDNVPAEKSVEGYPASKIETGERILESEITGNVYRVTKWVPHPDNQFTALEKEELPGDHPMSPPEAPEASNE